jgi:hypothetical protein
MLTEAAKANNTRVVKQLGVNGFTATNNWTLKGTTPYLNAIDNPTNIVFTSTASAICDRFNHTALTTSNIQVTTTKVCVYAKIKFRPICLEQYRNAKPLRLVKH